MMGDPDSSPTRKWARVSDSVKRAHVWMYWISVLCANLLLSHMVGVLHDDSTAPATLEYVTGAENKSEAR